MFAINLLAIILFAAAVHAAQIWYSLPLIVAISLVYAGTRHEEMGAILRHALRLGVWIAGFMVVVFFALFFM